MAAPAAAVGDADIARMIAFRVDRQHRATGIVVGVIRPSGRTITAYGGSDLKGSRKAGADTVYEIASLTKIFTALLLADAAVRGEARIDDPLSAYAPPGVGVPSFEGRAITLTDLATHGAGFPLRPDNLHAAPEARNKYANYTVDQLYAGLPAYKLTRAPGSRFEYSNVGFGLLGNGLALKLRTPYADLVRARITAPLGMSSTGLGISPAMRGRLAQGHDIDMKPVAPTDNGALNPAGGLRSTADDLLRFLDLFLGEDPGELTRAARLMMTVDRPGEDDHTRMALGWRRTAVDGEVFYWSNGSGDGSRTFMGFNPARHIAVVALANASSAEGVDDIGKSVLDQATHVNLTVPAVHHPITLTAAALDRFVGTYRFAPDDQIVIERDGERLYCLSGPNRLPILPESPTRFFSKLADAQFDFGPEAAAPPASFVLRQGGESFTYKRVR